MGVGVLTIITCAFIAKVVFEDVDEGVCIRVQEVSVSSKAVEILLAISLVISEELSASCSQGIAMDTVCDLFG